MKMKIQHTEVYGMQQTTPKAEFYSNTVLSQKTRKISDKLRTYNLKELEKKNKQNLKSAEGRK